MLVGGVIGHEVEDDLDPSPMRLAEQAVDILRVPKTGSTSQ